MKYASCVGLLVVLTTAAAEARVTLIEISRREPFAAGQAFGAVGAYERIVGRFFGELELNQRLTAHARAPRKKPASASSALVPRP